MTIKALFFPVFTGSTNAKQQKRPTLVDIHLQKDHVYISYQIREAIYNFICTKSYMGWGKDQVKLFYGGVKTKPFLIVSRKGVYGKDLNLCFDQWQREHNYDYGDQYGQVFIIKVKSYTKVSDSNHQYVLSSFAQDDVGGEPTEDPSTSEALPSELVSDPNISTLMNINFEEENKKRRKRRNRSNKKSKKSSDDESDNEKNSEESGCNDPLEEQYNEFTEFDDFEDIDQMKGTSRSISSTVHVESDPHYSLFSTQSSSHIHPPLPPPPPTSSQTTTATTTTWNPMMTNFTDPQFYAVCSPRFNRRVDQEKMSRLAIISSMITLANEEGLLRQLSIKAEQEVWSLDNNSESLEILEQVLFALMVGALEHNNNQQSGIVISRPKTSVFHSETNRSVSKNRNKDKMAINTSLIHKNEKSYLYAIIQQKNIVSEPSRCELIRKFYVKHLYSSSSSSSSSSSHDASHVKEWIEVCDFVLWNEAVEKYGFDLHDRPRTVRFVPHVGEYVFDTDLHLFFDQQVLEQCKEKIPLWLGMVDDSVAQTLCVQRMLSACVQELFNRIEQDYRTAIPGVVLESGIVHDDGDSCIQFFLPLFMVDVSLRGMYLCVRRRGRYYRAYRIAGRNEAYALARPISRPLMDKEWWKVY
ncbi:hypothetical protein AKO1_014229 [Acrasis kona]|uniref:DUF3825 domain-containing protein n=1 Tax=Acrasis kona TaxID=1008807 RepID=A0AAW2YZB0_9EUKA